MTAISPTELIYVMEHDAHTTPKPATYSAAGVALRVRLTREALGLSQSEMFRMLGFSRSGWNNIETGDSRITVDTIVHLMELFPNAGLSADWFYFGWRDKLSRVFRQRIEELNPIQQ